MKGKMLDEIYHTNPETGFLCRYIKSDTERFTPHYHNYYEIFLMLKGEAKHIVNDTEHILSPGNLLFIRDFDSHEYIRNGNETFDFINLAFRKKEFASMCAYLGNDFNSEQLFTHELPPLISLTETEKNRVFFSLSELINIDDVSVARIKFKKLLTDLFTTFFFDYTPSKSEIPLWLEVTYEKMKKPQNFIYGVEKMYEISGKSREHLSRSLKKYYNTTPTDLVSDLRLNYCANLLLSSNLSVTDICYECGFDNLSWFYKIFLKKYKISPGQYRKLHMWQKNF
ncbi:MAG: helix-turn-helix domain-containing protein [Clostridia bacterium]|nr:helix-turn-helix domain-containing protein [Clostridia bacterium]